MPVSQSLLLSLYVLHSKQHEGGKTLISFFIVLPETAGLCGKQGGDRLSVPLPWTEIRPVQLLPSRTSQISKPSLWTACSSLSKHISLWDKPLPCWINIESWEDLEGEEDQWIRDSTHCKKLQAGRVLRALQFSHVTQLSLTIYWCMDQYIMWPLQHNKTNRQSVKHKESIYQSINKSMNQSLTCPSTHSIP